MWTTVTNIKCAVLKLRTYWSFLIASSSHYPIWKMVSFLYVPATQFGVTHEIPCAAALTEPQPSKMFWNGALLRKPRVVLFTILFRAMLSL